MEAVDDGTVVLQPDYEKTRVNGKIKADWTENISSCSVKTFPDYDPTFFNDYCSFFYWCWRDYTTECEPNFAFGVTETQYRYFWGLVVGIPILIGYLVSGFSLFPFGLCMYAYNTDMTECSFGLITTEDGEHVYIE